MTDYDKDMWLLHATVSDMVSEFMLTAGQDTDADWYEDNEVRKLRDSLLEEEVEEALDASSQAAVLKELVDVVYVAVGYAVAFGWDFDEAFRRVHESNMSKLSGATERRSDGKIAKSSTYIKPDLGDLV